MLNPFLNIPDQQAQLKDGRPVIIRHGRPGDEPDIARLIAPAFAVYGWAARGNLERAAQNLAPELDPQTFVVAASETGQLIGATRISGRYRQPGKSWPLIKRKLKLWGLYGLICFGLKGLYNRMFDTPYRLKPGELLKSLAGVDVQYRSLGVAQHIANFIDDYAQTVGYHLVSSVHLSTNAPVLALQRKRGCVLTQRPPTLLAKLFRHPPIFNSSRVIGPPSADLSN